MAKCLTMSMRFACVQIAESLSLLLLLLFSSLGQQILADVTVPSLPIAGSSFTLTTRVTVDSSLSRANRRNKIHFEEFYSLAQGRAKITYRTRENDLLEDLQLPEAGNFHVSKGGLVFLASRDAESKKGSCKLTNKNTVKRVAQTILFDELRQDFVAGGRLHILGPASVLFLMEKLKPQLKKVNEFGLTVRNVPAIMFEYSADETPTTRGLHFFCLYAKEHVQAEFAMPLGIVLSLPGGQNVEYEFLEFRKFDNSLQLVEAVEGLSDVDAGILLDPLAIEPGIGCASNALALPNDENNPFHGSNETRFHFRARITQAGGQMKPVTVAYEGSLDMMRVDQKPGSSLLLNLELGKAYHFAMRRSHEDGVTSLGRVLELSADSTQQEDSCILTKIPTRNEMKKLGSLYDLNHLLVGASGDNFIYLGRARVRGVWTRVYEAHTFSWPVWLEQTIPFTRNWTHDDPQEQHIYGLHDLLNIVLYLEEQPEARGGRQRALEQRTVARPLMVQITRLKPSDSSPLDSNTIQMYDFSWQLAAHSPADGLSISDHFSLGDNCLALTRAESNHYARAEMLLASQKHHTSKALARFQQAPRSLLNLALLQSLRENLKLAPELIYDLQSALQLKRLQQAEEFAASLLVSFRLARHRQVVSKLRFYGTGEPKKMVQFKLWRFQAPFSECFYLAAHHKLDTFFAHSSHNQLCLIDLNRRPETIVEKSLFFKPAAFDLFTNGPMEVYFVHHAPDAALIQADPISSLNSKRAYSLARVMHKFPIWMCDSTAGSAANIYKSSDQFDFHIKHFNLHELDEKHSFKVDDAFSIDTNKFFDFALVPDRSPFNRPVTTIDAEHSMDFATCQTACLRDQSCQSFSVCLVRAKYRCILSKASLKDSKVLLKLLDIRSNREAKFGQTFELHTETAQVFSIKKQHNCELHAKMYLDMYNGPASTIQMPFFSTNWTQAIHQVDGRDDCARICYRQTYDLLEQDLTTSNLKLKLEQMISSEATDDKQQEAALREAFEQHRARLRGLCSDFLFLDASAYSSLSLELQELIRSSASYHHNSLLDDSPVNNFCLTVQPKLAGEGAESKLASSAEFRQLEFERFRFKFELLFERQHGVKMRQSPMNKSELRAYGEVRLLQTFRSKESMELMRNFLDRHENIQDNVAMSQWDESKCALLCMQQLRGLWPSCKSFDMLIIATGSTVNTMCRLNSMTLRQAQAHGRNDLLEYDTRFAKVQVWHYEPSLGAVQDELELESLFESVEAALEEPKLASGAATLLFVVLFALIVGLATGIELGSRMVQANATEPDETTDTGRLVQTTETLDMNTFRKTRG